jgi:hypothetical protein
MATPTLINTLNPLENLNQFTISSPLHSSSTGSNKRPAIRVLAGPLRLTSYRAFPILLDASDALVVGFAVVQHGCLTYVRTVGSIARVRDGG